MSVWPSMRLDECCEIIAGATPSTSESTFWGGDVCWATPKDLSNLDGTFISDTPRKLTAAGLQSCAASVLPAHSVLFSSRAPIGHVAINTVPMATNQGFKSFIPKAGRIVSEFLYWWLRYNRAYLESLGNGATFKEVSKAIVSRVEIALPPLEEQRRIAAILDQAETVRCQRRAALAQLDCLTQSIFLDMFGDPVVNMKGLPVCFLGDLCTRITDGTHQSPKWEVSGIPFLFISNIVDGLITFDTHKFISTETHLELTRRCPIEIGDVLYTTVGSYGNAAIVDTSDRFAFQRHIAHIKPDVTKANSIFIAAMIQSIGVRRQVDKVAKGVAQKTVNLADLKCLLVFAPPLPLQQTFATRIQAIESLKTTHRTALAELDALFASLQQRAFAGEL